ncbi:MAG: tetraacyldisaccharide 4'-kinase [Candidatus Binatia bacterium]
MSRVTSQLREAVWARRGLGGWAAWLALQPASGLFTTGVALRNLGYRVGVLRTYRARIAVVSVGNLSVGGSGKTPLTLWLARALAVPGVRVAIVLRGYGGRARHVTVVSVGNGPEVDVETAGDEAVMLAKCFAGPVLTARRRAEGVAAAEHLGCNVAVLDDGFQHRALARDFDLVLIDGHRRTVLPAGPLRERQSALGRADAVVFVDKADERPTTVPAAAGVSTPLFVARFAPTALIESDAGRWRELPLRALSGRRVAVVAGIAEPAPFFAAVRGWDAQIAEFFEFNDHHHYTLLDWQHISRATRDVELVVTTEKDLVKLERFPFARGKLVALRITPQIDDGDALIRMVAARAGLAEGRSHTKEDADGY